MAAKLDIQYLCQFKGQVFRAQDAMLPVWQTLADHFYPERSDFTMPANVGMGFADHLLSSSPLMMRRDLGNTLSAMLRDGDWFELTVDGGEPDYMGGVWLDHATKRLMKLMKSRQSGFSRATKQGDHDYITFGQCVLSAEPNRDRNGLLIRNWHLRDCAWWDGPDGNVEGVVRKWTPTARDLYRTFGDRCHPKVIELVNGPLSQRKPFQEISCFHMVMPVDMYGDEQFMHRKYVSIYVDETNKHMIEEVGINYRYYAVPRFQTIAGSPYAYSTATVIALPNARLLQAMTHTILEAGERLARPPIIATQQVVRSDVDLSPDGITWVDKDYDEKLGAALRTLDTRGGGSFPLGHDLMMSVAEVLQQSFFLNTINLPNPDREMTAYEMSERMKQFRRQNLPIFEPIEVEYNGQLCELCFDLAMAEGLMGSVYDIPQSLRDRDVTFKFQSPLSSTEGEKRMNLFTQVSEILRLTAENDPGVRHNFNFDVAFRQAIEGVGAPDDWLRDPEAVAQGRMGDMMQQAGMMAAQQGAA